MADSYDVFVGFHGASNRYVAVLAYPDTLDPTRVHQITSMFTEAGFTTNVTRDAARTAVVAIRSMLRMSDRNTVVSLPGASSLTAAMNQLGTALGAALDP